MHKNKIYHSIGHIFILFQNIKIEIYKIIILSVVLHGCET
jgi:hypothetical protein